jgi:NAD-dependent dihydropyrimidine dehydrogenase PreA subunit
MPYVIVINERLCHGCGDCSSACPQNVLSIKIHDTENMILIIRAGKAHVVKQEPCDGCGMCIEACPVKAIKIIIPAKEVTP